MRRCPSLRISIAIIIAPRGRRWSWSAISNDPDATNRKSRPAFPNWNPSGTGRPGILRSMGPPQKRGQGGAGLHGSRCAPIRCPCLGCPLTTTRLTPPRTASATASKGSGSASSISGLRKPPRIPTRRSEAACAGSGNTTRSAKIASFRVSYAGDKWQRALEEADKIRRQVLAGGVTQQEVDRQVIGSMTGGAGEPLRLFDARVARSGARARRYDRQRGRVQ